jgi:diguanylate cyclase (GGDEF)-like protein
MADPLVIEGRKLTIAASIGIAVYPEDGTDAAGLLRSADDAMYEVKQAGRNGFRFSSRRRPARAASSVA